MSCDSITESFRLPQCSYGLVRGMIKLFVDCDSRTEQKILRSAEKFAFEQLAACFHAHLWRKQKVQFPDFRTVRCQKRYSGVRGLKV